MTTASVSTALLGIATFRDVNIALRQAMSDQAYGFDKNGNEVRLPHDDGSPYLIRDNAQYVQDQAGTSRVIGEPTYPVGVHS